MQSALWEYKLGTVVAKNNKEDMSWGHVTGFKKTAKNKVAISVQWDDGSTSLVQPKSLLTLESMCP